MNVDRGSKGKLLIAASDIPYPPNYGGRRDIYERLRHLSVAGYSIHLIASTRAEVPPEAVQHLSSLVTELTIVPRKRGVRQVLSFKPFQHASRSNLSKVPLRDAYDAVILEGEYTGAILSNPLLKARHVALRVHNNEADYYRALAAVASSMVAKIFYTLEGKKFGRYSKKMYAKADYLWFISFDELRAFKSRNPAYPGIAAFLPVLVNVETFKSQPLDGNNVLYIGDLSLSTNRQSILWYLDNVHEKLANIGGYNFILAGKTGGSLPSAFEARIKNDPHVRFHPDPPTLDSLYRSASVFINPIQHGAGLKIKTIDAMIAGIPVVATSVGAEGAGFENKTHLLIEDSPENFAQCVVQLLTDKACARALTLHAQAYLRERFGPAELERLAAQLVQ